MVRTTRMAHFKATASQKLGLSRASDVEESVSSRAIQP